MVSFVPRRHGVLQIPRVPFLARFVRGELHFYPKLRLELSWQELLVKKLVICCVEFVSDHQIYQGVLKEVLDAPEVPLVFADEGVDPVCRHALAVGVVVLLVHVCELSDFEEIARSA